MRIRLLPTAVLTLPLFVACADSPSEGPDPFDDEHGPSEDNVNEGAPPSGSLPDEGKADAVYPPTFQLGNQSPVKSQGSRGVCSIFSATAQVEELYIKAGMPVAEADFSEQYLQWAAKNLQRAFMNTEGSSSGENLQAVVRFGTVKEGEWVYETAPWTTANDPACTGESRPTKCYTNGEPPANVAQATKYKLPASRWVSSNVNSIKAVLTSKNTGVNVGMTFFYQSWNHRASTLPVNSEYWRKGYVTYPNAEDKQKSLEKRAGHAIHIIGWDDNLEVAKRDGAGNPILDANGVAVKEKGFFLFKNSWGIVGFGIEHPAGPGYGWLSYQYVKEYGSAVAADVPVLNQPTAEVCTDGIDNDGDSKIDCDDSNCSTNPVCTGGGTSHTYSASPAAAIPDNNPTGVSSTIDVSDTGALADVKVSVDITHTYRGDLKVTIAKGTFSKVLVDGVGGGADDLRQTFTVSGVAGLSNDGTWTLTVVDKAGADVGTLNSWKLETKTN